MNDQDALLAAITANRYDETPKLAYADWLEGEGNNEARAAFIRLQCAKSTLLDDAQRQADRYHRFPVPEAARAQYIALVQEELTLLRENEGLRKELKDALTRARPSAHATIAFLDNIAKDECYHTLIGREGEEGEVQRYVASGACPDLKDPVAKVFYPYQDFERCFDDGLLQSARLGTYQTNPEEGSQIFAWQVENIRGLKEPIGLLILQGANTLPTAQDFGLPMVREVQINSENPVVSMGLFEELSHHKGLQGVTEIHAHRMPALTLATARRFAAGEGIGNLETLRIHFGGDIEAGIADALRQSNIGRNAEIRVAPNYPIGDWNTNARYTDEHAVLLRHNQRVLDGRQERCDAEQAAEKAEKAARQAEKEDAARTQALKNLRAIPPSSRAAMKSAQERLESHSDERRGGIRGWW